MILAGPGSGKTTVITHRVWSLVKDGKVDENAILVITFTKMAAVEMKDRFLKMGNLHSTSVNFGTFHAVFFSILKDAYGFSAADIVKVSQQWKFVKTQFSLYNVDVRDENNTISDILSEIAKVKGLNRESRGAYVPKSCEARLFFNIFDEYQRWLKGSHMVDFEDMMTETYELFKKDTSQLARWQERFKYILVDEFQDASPMQFEIVKMLAGTLRNVFIVGDDDQSIYGFRGAAPAVMQDFKAVYPDTAVYTLNINYRSNAAVVEAATRLINCNKDRFYKDLTAFHDRGCDVQKLEFETMHDENVYIARLLNDNLTTAILTRTNISAADMKRFLEHEGIFADVKSGSKGGDRLFSHWIALDVAAYVKIALGSRERADYVRIINKPVRYISRQFFVDSSVDLDFILQRMRQGNQGRLVERMQEFRGQTMVLSKMTPFAGINYIRKGIGYDRYIMEYAREQNVDSHTFMEILDRLQESARDYETYEEWLELYEECGQSKEDTGLQKNEDKIKSKINNVTICTMHSSKGLEYERVIIIDANEGVTPYNKAVTKEDIEEERRLFYVAMTRAKEQLIICSVRRRYNKPLLPSRFLKEF
jgi:DNA helicase-2/ATP-dependent DNA helicase PcrA